MSKKNKHIATCAVVNAWGLRVGVHYIYDFDEARTSRHRPYFRFRNVQCLFDYTAYWAKNEPRKTTTPPEDKP
jgi:hypothetical protein